MDRLAIIDAAGRMAAAEGQPQTTFVVNMPASLIGLERVSH
jgi:hypothetical protein